MHRPTPALCLICPPLTGGTDCIIREAGQRQTWQRVTLSAPQLDYWNLDLLAPGWACWEHQGRYLSDHSVQVLNYLKLPPPSGD